MQRLIAIACFGALLTTSAFAQDSLNVRRMGELTFGDLAFKVVVQGDYAYVAGNAEGLLIIDISDPAAPVVVGVSHAPI
jgi:hypothetical protein